MDIYNQFKVTPPKRETPHSTPNIISLPKPQETNEPSVTKPNFELTKKGYLTCITEKNLDEALNYAVKHDNSAFSQMIESRECIVLRHRMH